MEVFQQDMETSKRNVPKSEYEQLREMKIARNQRRLAELGLLNLGTRSKEPTKRKHPGQASIGSNQKPKSLPRRSERLRLSITNQKASSRGDEDYGIDIPSSSTTELVPKKKSSRKAHRPNISIHQPVILAGGKISTRFLHLNVNEILTNFLGQQLEMSGKDAVISQMSRYLSLKDANEIAGSNRISFNKYSGVLEWKNALFLWVNLKNASCSKSSHSSDQDSVRNEFFNNGRSISWFGGSKMTEDTPVIQRLIDINVSAISKEHDAVILWVRYSLETPSTMSPYICLGRCGYDNHVIGSRPLKFSLSLLDYDKLNLLMSKEDDSKSILKKILL